MCTYCHTPVKGNMVTHENDVTDICPLFLYILMTVKLEILGKGNLYLRSERSPCQHFFHGNNDFELILI
jgi:hypothetical protein